MYLNAFKQEFSILKSTTEELWASSFFDENFLMSAPGGHGVFVGVLIGIDWPDISSLLAGNFESATVQRKRGPRKPGDMFITSHSPIAVSKRVLDLLEKEQLTGWNATPLEVLSGKNKFEGEFFILGTNEFCGPVRYDHSRYVKIENPNIPMPAWEVHGGYVDPVTAPGTDFFRNPNSRGRIYVSRRARDALLTLKIKNLTFESFRDFKFISLKRFDNQT